MRAWGRWSWPLPRRRAARDHSLKDPWFPSPTIQNGRQRAKGKTVETLELPGAVHRVVKVAEARDAILGILARHTGPRR